MILDDIKKESSTQKEQRKNVKEERILGRLK